MMFNVQLTMLIWSHLRNKKFYILLYICIAIICAAEISISSYLLKIIINTIHKHQDNNKSLLTTIQTPMILYISISLITNLNTRIYNYINLNLYPKLKAAIIKDLYSYLLDHSYTFFQNNSSGNLTKKIFDISNSIATMLHIINESFLPMIFVLIISSITLTLTINPIFSAILALWSICFILLSYHISKKIKIYSQNLSESNFIISGKISDSILNFMNIKWFASKKSEENIINASIENAIQNERCVYWENMKVHFIQGICVTILISIMMITLIYSYNYGLVNAGDFALVLTLSISILRIIYSIGYNILEFATLVGICKQGLSIINNPHEIVDVIHAKGIDIKNGLIEFKNINFCYKDQNPLYNNLNISINSKEKIGLVGYSGAGKSTFIKLLLRLIEPQSGKILIDGQEISKVTLHSLAKQITVIPQEQNLFHRSIIENISFVNPNATYKEVLEASKRAHCHEFISKLPDGYNSLIGENGIKLSGGQKQRIGIARAFLKNSPILLLDEPTSALDPFTERLIYESLKELAQNKTTIVIAHRLTTLKSMDRLLVFDNGKIVEDGNLEDLKKNINGIFYHLWQTQIKV